MKRFYLVIFAVGITLASLQGCGAGSSSNNNNNANVSSTTGTTFWPSVSLQ